MQTLLNKKEVSQLFGVSVKTIDSWVSKRKIPYVKAGAKLIRFRKADLENYLERRTVKTT